MVQQIKIIWLQMAIDLTFSEAIGSEFQVALPCKRERTT
jgi:hypothetical protein